MQERHARQQLQQMKGPCSIMCTPLCLLCGPWSHDPKSHPVSISTIHSQLHHKPLMPSTAAARTLLLRCKKDPACERLRPRT